mgnify:CR=1 FL=1|tara:strand:- start:44597 stop:45220 length:624 start_codon:yes stop_codon:yes gene_type:complete
MKALAIIGASGHGKVVADCALECGWQSITFFDDGWPGIGMNGCWSVAGDTRSLLDSLSDYDGVFVAIGHGKARYAKLSDLRKAAAPLVSLIHPRATVSRYASVGVASVILAGAVVNVDVRIGEGVIVNTAASVDHDCVLGGCAHISPGAHLAGGVTIGDRAWVGIGASVRQGVSIGADVTVGAGAAVVGDIEAGFTVVGVPARPLLG